MSERRNVYGVLILPESADARFWLARTGRRGRRHHYFGADVFAELHAFEMDFGDGGVGFGAGFVEGIAQGGDAQDAAAGGDEFVILESGAGVEDLQVGGRGGFGGLFEAGDFDAFFYLLVGLPAVA